MAKVRDTLSLDGLWEFRQDPKDEGVARGWFDGGEPFERELPVPLPWQAADPALRRYTGVAWYRRTFRVPPEWRGRAVAVRFGAVDYDARVWMNGREIGGHSGGYTPFEVETEGALDSNGENVLALRVYDPPVTSEIPHGKQGGIWYTPVSGPWGSVSLVARPRQRVERVRLYPDAMRGTVRVAAACLPEPDATLRLDLAVLDGDDEVTRATAVVAGDAPTALVELLIPNPKRWSPDSPALYTVRATLRSPDGSVLDQLDERFGLRTFEARGGRLLLNGKPFWMRGALDQGYWPDTLYTAPPDSDIEREIRLAKEMGLNLLRKHIKPEDPRYLDACDRLGMLVWAEPANAMRFTPEAREAQRRDLLEMIDRDFNRPSVVIWSLYNEDWGLPGLWSDPEQHAWLDALYREVKAIDPTRPVVDNSGWAHVLTDLNDYHEYYAVPERVHPFRDRLNFITAHPEDNFAHGHTPLGEPVLISEWGNWAIPDPALARERAGGVDPHWFGYDREHAGMEGNPEARVPPTPTARVRVVRGFEERFAALGLERVFGTTAALAEHAQRRALRSITAQIEEMRRRPALSGYVVTEFTDTEWEGNGWLDYWRQPKAFHADLASINGDIALIAVPERPNVWGGDELVVRLHLSNMTPRPLNGSVRWQLAGTTLAGELPATAPPFTTIEVPAALRVRLPEHSPPAATRLEIELVQGGETRARTYAAVTYAPRAAGRIESLPVNGHTLDRVFRQRLERQGYRIPRAFSHRIPMAITMRLDEHVIEYIRTGGRVLYLPGTSGEGADLAGLRFVTLQPGESWRMAAGVAWARPDRLAPAPVLADLGWEVSDFFPGLAVDASVLRPQDEQYAGWFEGWLANAGALALRRPLGDGQLLVCGFRVEEAYGRDPVATLLLNRLVQILGEA